MIDNNENRIQRLSFILTQLSKGNKLSTSKLAEQFNTTIRKIQLDFKEYLIPLFGDETIYYEHSIKCYLSKINFLQRTFFTSEELAVISILKTKSKDKYCDDNLSIKTDLLFDKFEDCLKNSIYENLSIEKIDNNNTQIVQIRNAIKSKNAIECEYNKKPRNLYPLKILNLNSFWYLINYDLEYQESSNVYNANGELLKSENLNDMKIYNLDKHFTEEFKNKFNTTNDRKVDLYKGII